MRKYLSLLLAASLVACSKETPKEVEVTFNLGVQSGPMTRAGNEGVYEALSITAPPAPFYLDARSTEDNSLSYSMVTGEPLTMTVGEYEVTGAGYGPTIEKANNGTLYYWPYWEVDEMVDVSVDATEYTVQANFKCFALVFDRSEVARVELFVPSRGCVDLRMNGSDDYWVLYATPDEGFEWSSSNSLHLYVHPVDELHYQMRAFYIGNVTGGQSHDDYVNATFGYWYKLSPCEVTETSGAMWISFPEWQEGSF